jgi:hypothetical protein
MKKPGFLQKKPNRFLQLITDQTRLTREGLDALHAYVRNPSREYADKVRRLEKEADEVRRILIDELNRTYITPFERGDIFRLSRAIDDVIDYAHTTVSEMDTLEVNPTSFMMRIVSLLSQAAEELHRGVLQLVDHPAVASDHAIRAKALENRVDQVYREGVADLFRLPRDLDHVVEMLKLREVYRHLSNAADRGDEAANVIADIVVKMP